jgi:hypothetical protein
MLLWMGSMLRVQVASTQLVHNAPAKTMWKFVALAPQHPELRIRCESVVRPATKAGIMTKSRRRAGVCPVMLNRFRSVAETRRKAGAGMP